MKNFTLFIASFILLIASQTYGQALRSTSIATPAIQTGASAINTAFAAGTYALDNLNEITASSTALMAYPRIASLQTTPAGGFEYTIESRSTNLLNPLLKGLATSVVSEPIYIRNTGTGNVNMVAGYFGCVDAAGTKRVGNIRITVDDYVYEYSSTLESTIRGFVFPEAFTEVKIESLDNYCPAISRIYWGSSLPATSVPEATKRVIISPNPTTDGIIVNADGIASIYALNGQEILSQAVSQGAYISLSNLSAGLYILKVISDTGVLQEKLIKK